METRKSYGQPAELNHSEVFFRLINPNEYSRFGINAEDVPIGTFAAEDHPVFLPSRFGGNAYGLGLVEQEVLSKADTDFLETVDFENPKELRKHSQKLNAIYQKLGLLIRFSATGKRYFLIPINLVAHSFQEVKTKADEIESLIKRHINETNSERLDIGLVTSLDDLIVHELTARFSNQRIHIFDSLDKLRSWRIPLDIVIVPKDPFRFLLEQRFPENAGRTVRKKDLGNLASYLAVKLFELLDKDGRLHVLAHSPVPDPGQVCRVRFKSHEELRCFLLFAHTFQTEGRYSPGQNGEMDIHISDLHYYLNRFAFSDPQLKKLLEHQRPEELSPEAIDRLPYLNIPLGNFQRKDPAKEWRKVFEPFFSIESLERKSSRTYEEYWEERLEIDRKLPEILLAMVAVRREPIVTLPSLEEEIRVSGMQGCALSLVAEYRKTFRFVLKVLDRLAAIRDHTVERLSELELNRLSNPFRLKSGGFQTILQLLDLVPKLEKIRGVFNPNLVEGPDVSIIENLEKLSLLGFSRAQLREILLIVVGHTTMTRIVFGKIPARTLKAITDRVREENQNEIFDLLRICRLMSMAEIIAAVGDAFMSEQTAELFRLYDEAVTVTTNPEMDWDKREDLRISTLGGIQNRAIREMMKFFNLFDFLNSWQDYLNKGELQREVICDYNPDRIARMRETMQLSEVAGEFKRKFLGDYIFGQSYFFRQFLDIEFHGSGPVFRSLGTRAGFILLWISVNSSDRNIVNFNPILAGIPMEDHPPRLEKLRQALLAIPVDRLHPGFFEGVKLNFAEHRPAFIFDSGIRLIVDPETRVLDVTFVDVEENIRKIEDLLKVFESRKLRNISLRNLQEMERRFSELMSFHQYIDRENSDTQCSIHGISGEIEQKTREIYEIEKRLELILRNQIFIPEEIYESISVLHEHCPGMLGFIIPELRGMGFLGGISPDPASGSLEDYVMRCLQKYQALVNRDRNSFQDRNTFYRLAKQEFGPLAEEDLGVSHPQLESLEYFIGRIREKPWLLQALTFALLFQEIGKLEKFSGPDPGNYWTHGPKGAEILRKFGVLKKFHLDPQVEDLAILLVRHHGLIGHVILGDEPVTALERLTAESDTHLLDAFLIHSVLASAAVMEGVMVSDFLDCFIHYRAVALEVIKSRTTWRDYLKEVLEEKGRALLNEFTFGSREDKLLTIEHVTHCGIADSGIDNEVLWQGRQSAALERLLKLAGSSWIDYEDLQIYLREIPINFIYHKKKLKSVGPATFERQLLKGVELLCLISSLAPEVRYYLFYCLDHLGGAMRIYDFQKLTDALGLSESLKLLIISLQSFHHYFGIERKCGLVSFADLSREPAGRLEILRNVLREFPFPEQCFEGQKVIFAPERFGELRFETGEPQLAINVTYRDTVRFDSMRQALADIWDSDELFKKYRQSIFDVRQMMPVGVEALEQELEKSFIRQKKKIDERALKGFQERLGRVADISDFQKIMEEIEATKSGYSFSEEHLFLLDEICEFNRFRIRDSYLDAIYQESSNLRTRESLLAFWNKLKTELYRYRSFIGKEYEMLIAKFIDDRLDRLEK